MAQAVQRALVVPFLARAFPGRPARVRFGFDFDKPPTPKEIFETAAIAKQAGWRIDKSQLEEQTGYMLEPDTPAEGGAFGKPGPLPLLNKEPPARPADQPADGDRAALAAFAKDTGPLADPSPEKARALMDRLPSLVPDPTGALATRAAGALADLFQRWTLALHARADDDCGFDVTGFTPGAIQCEGGTAPSFDRARAV